MVIFVGVLGAGGLRCRFDRGRGMKFEVNDAPGGAVARPPQ